MYAVLITKVLVNSNMSELVIYFVEWTICCYVIVTDAQSKFKIQSASWTSRVRLLLFIASPGPPRPRPHRLMNKIYIIKPFIMTVSRRYLMEIQFCVILLLKLWLLIFWATLFTYKNLVSCSTIDNNFENIKPFSNSLISFNYILVKEAKRVTDNPVYPQHTQTLSHEEALSIHISSHHGVIKTLLPLLRTNNYKNRRRTQSGLCFIYLTVDILSNL